MILLLLWNYIIGRRKNHKRSAFIPSKRQVIGFCRTFIRDEFAPSRTFYLRSHLNVAGIKKKTSWNKAGVRLVFRFAWPTLMAANGDLNGERRKGRHQSP